MGHEIDDVSDLIIYLPSVLILMDRSPSQIESSMTSFDGAVRIVSCAGMKLPFKMM
jgi:hypothetical protein